MSVLVDLPEDVGRDVLSWFDYNMLGSLDTALCCVHLRSSWLSLLAQPIEIKGDKSASVTFFDWVYERHVKLISMDINDEVLAKCKGLLTLSTDRIQTVFLAGMVLNKSLVGFLESCANLRNLYVDELFDIDLLTPGILKQLSELEISNEISIQLHRMIAQYCHRLLVFTATFVKFDADKYFVQIFKRNPTLVSITVCGSISLLNDIEQYCPAIESIDLHVPNTQILPVMMFLLRNPDIHCLNVSSRAQEVEYVCGPQQRILRLDVTMDLVEENISLEFVVKDITEFVFVGYPGVFDFPVLLLDWINLWRSSLKKLELTGVSTNQVNAVLTEHSSIPNLILEVNESSILQILTARCNQLKELRLSFYENVYLNFEDIVTLLVGCPLLEMAVILARSTLQDKLRWLSSDSLTIHHVNCLDLNLECDGDDDVLRLLYYNGIKQ